MNFQSNEFKERKIIKKRNHDWIIFSKSFAKPSFLSIIQSKPKRRNRFLIPDINQIEMHLKLLYEYSTILIINQSTQTQSLTQTSQTSLLN